MIIVDLAEETGNLVFHPHLTTLLEASGILEDITSLSESAATYSTVNLMDTRPISEDVHLEVAGPTLARILETPVLHPDYPKAAVKAQHIKISLNAERAFAGFQSFVDTAWNQAARIDFPPVPRGTHFDSLALFTIQVKYAPTHGFFAFAQVHYDKKGIAKPFDIATVVDMGGALHGEPLEQLGSLKNLALAVFGRQRMVEAYPSEIRRVYITTTEGRVPLDFQHLRPLPNQNAPRKTEGN